MTPRKKPAPVEVSGGLWIRVAANLSRRKVVWRLTATCLASFPVPPGAPRSLYQKAAIGFLVELWGNIAEHTADGTIAPLPDGQLEQWAGWDGEPGAFATWLRAQHLDASTGKCREWDELAGALQTRRQADADRQRAKRERAKLAAQILDEVDLGDGSDSFLNREAQKEEPTASNEGEKTEAVDVGPIALQLTIAANRGMQDNPDIGNAFNPIIPTRGDGLETVAAFMADGLTDWTLVARIIYTLAKHYKPTKRGDHVRSLVFFRERTIRVYRQHVEKVRAAAGLPPGEVSIDPKRPSAAAKAVRTAAGALAAAQSAGLDE